MSKAPFNLDEYKNDLDVDDVFGEEGYSTNERTSIRPSLDVNGIWGGYIGEGANRSSVKGICKNIDAFSSKPIIRRNYTSF